MGTKVRGPAGQEVCSTPLWGAAPGAPGHLLTPGRAFRLCQPRNAGSRPGACRHPYILPGGNCATLSKTGFSRDNIPPELAPHLIRVRTRGEAFNNWWRLRATNNTRGIFRAGENMNLQILVRQNLRHFLKMSEQIMCGSQ